MQVDASSDSSLIDLLKTRAGRKPQAAVGSGNSAAAAGFATMVAQMTSEMSDMLATESTGATGTASSAAAGAVSETHPRDLLRLLENGGGGDSTAGSAAGRESMFNELLKGNSQSATTPSEQFATFMQLKVQGAYGTAGS